MKHILLVDGYNMIGDWHELRPLRENDFEAARNRLVELMAEYSAATGWQVIVVFDAYLVDGVEQQYSNSGITVVYTAKNETADECIERLSMSLKSRVVQIHVATSDMTEQNVIFGNGALRISARELEIEMSIIQKNIAKDVRTKQNTKPSTRITLTPEVEKAFEKMRRGLK